MKTTTGFTLLLLMLLCLLNTHAGIIFDWATVGNPGNAGEVQTQGTFGGVPYTYRISKHEHAIRSGNSGHAECPQKRC